MLITGYLFDIYNFENDICLWVIDDNKCLNFVTDVYYPVIYADGPPELLQKLVKRLYQLNALLQKPDWVIKKHFYKNIDIEVLRLIISRPSVLYRVREKLFAFYGKMDIYHSDIDLTTSYLYDKDLYPLAKVEIKTKIEKRQNRVVEIKSLSPVESLNYKIPSFRIMRMYCKESARLKISEKNPLVLKTESSVYELSQKNRVDFLKNINIILQKENPDCIVSSFGDQAIFPVLFELSKKYKIPLNFDRDTMPLSARKIVKKGKSFFTYGSYIFRAPSYPLFGRWHIDSANSFTYKETQLLGVIELARVSRMPVQKLARASTGSALTAMETAVAMEKNYLIPWQKSSLESKKTWYELHLFDKGGLVFMPDTSKGFIKENIAQLDFSQMYPSIMHIHNISPETVNCLCCRNTSAKKNIPRVPELNYHICVKRRGVVSDTLRHVLRRRAYYKKMKGKSTGYKKELYTSLADSLKWINVVSFGYLGFRNAKFGKLESHESVTAFGRDILLTAMHLAEDKGFNLIHAITDCIFIDKGGELLLKEEIEELCRTIYRTVKIKITTDGIYTWLLFLSSREDSKLPVAGKYLGRFETGELKYRGIAARRKDMPVFIRRAQLELLEIMKEAATVSELKKQHDKMHLLYLFYDEQIKERKVSYKEMLLRKTVTRDLNGYLVANATSLSVKQLFEKGISVQPGEKVRYLVLDQKNPLKEKRYISEESALFAFQKRPAKYDISFYHKLWKESYEEIWRPFAPEGYFELLDKKQMQLGFSFS
ncbi:MAG: DNA polymerase [Spirochaetia bacterium]|nr:DNA polymerase [Spirochaetia bacterium]